MTRLQLHRGATTGARLALLLALAAGCSFAQGRGGGGPGGGGGGMGMPGGSGMGRGPFGGNPSVMDNRNAPPPGSRPNASSSTESTMGGGLQLGPPGRWWDNREFAQSIGLNNEQQKRMDAIFSENKNTLVKLYKNLQHEESQLAKATRAKNLDENEIFQQIDRVTQARGDLEKANAHMLLTIRKEMNADQAARLDDHRPTQ